MNASSFSILARLSQAALSASAFLLLASAALTQSCAHKSSASAGAQSLSAERGKAVAVRTANIERVAVPHLLATTGLLGSAHEQKLSFKIGGVIGKIAVEEGEFFRKGQTLATLHTAEIDAQTEQALLGLEKARRDYTRTMNLFQDSVATLEQVQNAKTGLEAAQKSLDVASFNRRYAVIVAASDGFVAKKIANEGEVIAPGSPALIVSEIGGNAAWVIKAGVSDAEWAGLILRRRATVEFDAFPGRSFGAIVSRKARAADPAGGLFQVEFTLDDANLPKDQLALGMFCKVALAAETANSAYRIPYDALIEANGNRAFVFAPTAGGKRVVKQPVEILSFDQNAALIKSGLENIREVVVSNSAFLNEQSTIVIVK
jgi:RND family efflux transporter MFP subunit